MPDGDIYFCCRTHMLLSPPSPPPVVPACFLQLPTVQKETPVATVCSQLLSHGRTFLGLESPVVEVRLMLGNKLFFSVWIIFYKHLTASVSL